MTAGSPSQGRCAIKARYVDLPYEALPHVLAWGDKWDAHRGKPVEISSHPFVGHVHHANCDGPWFEIVGEFTAPYGWQRVSCIHVLELDEGALDAEVEAIAREVLA